MGFFSDMNNSEFSDGELETKPITPSKTVNSKEGAAPVVKPVKKSSVLEDVVSDDDFDEENGGFTEDEIEEMLGEDSNMPFDGEEEVEEVKHVAPAPKPTLHANRPEPGPAPVASPARKMTVTSGSVISQDAVVEGNLTLASAVTVLGKITGFLSAGDITLETSGEVLGGLAGGNVSIDGKVDGDVKGTNVTIGNCRIKGNICADKSLTISNKATVIGDVTAGEGDVFIYGKIKGNVESTGTVTLKTGSVIKGNIAAVEVITERGATFQGSIFKAGEIDDSMFE